MSPELMQTYWIANVSFLVLSQPVFNARRSDCQETLTASRVNSAASVMTVSKRRFRLKVNNAASLRDFWP